MNRDIFIKVIVVLVAILIVLTIAHFVYGVYAYQHCSIIQFIAKELW